MSNTEKQYWNIIKPCQTVFEHKITDYGTSWRVLRPISLVDQIYIKAMRIRLLQSGAENKVGDNVEGEWKAIINYGIIACIQLIENNYNEDWDWTLEQSTIKYEEQIQLIFNLMQAKNHDYGEAWRNMSQEGLVDLIITKLLRVKQIISNDGKTVISEGIDANFHDIVNYAIFALILKGEASI